MKKFLLIIVVLMFHAIVYSINDVFEHIATAFQNINDEHRIKLKEEQKKQLAEEATRKEKENMLDKIRKSNKVIDDFLNNKNGETLKNAIYSTNSDIIALWDLLSQDEKYKESKYILSKIDEKTLSRISEAIANNDKDKHLEQFISVIKKANNTSPLLEELIKKSYTKGWPFAEPYMATVKEKNLREELQKAYEHHDNYPLVTTFQKVDKKFGDLLEKNKEFQNFITQQENYLPYLIQLFENKEFRDLFTQDAIDELIKTIWPTPTKKMQKYHNASEGSEQLWLMQNIADEYIEKFGKLPSDFDLVGISEQWSKEINNLNNAFKAAAIKYIPTKEVSDTLIAIAVGNNNNKDIDSDNFKQKLEDKKISFKEFQSKGGVVRMFLDSLREKKELIPAWNSLTERQKDTVYEKYADEFLDSNDAQNFVNDLIKDNKI